MTKKRCIDIDGNRLVRAGKGQKIRSLNQFNENSSLRAIANKQHTTATAAAAAHNIQV